MKNSEWALFVSQKRKSNRLTRRKLAELASIDPSYVTLIERDGYVPRRDKVMDIAKAVLADVDRTLLIAGYAPETISTEQLLEGLDNIKTSQVLEKDLRSVIHDFFTLSPNEQKKVAEMLKAYMHTIRPSRSAYQSDSIQANS